MHILIDGYNLIRQSPELRHHERRSLDAGRLALIRQLAVYQQQRGHKITVVFDGWQGGSPMEERDREGVIDIIYSRRGETADAVIRRLARDGGEEVLVVTSDRDIADHLGRKGAVAISSTEFSARLERAGIFSPMGDSGRDKEEAFEEKEEEEKMPKSARSKKGMARKPSRREKQLQKRINKL